LVVNREEAPRVRQIFDWYLEGESALKIVAKAERLGWRNKQWTTREGRPYGGGVLGKAHIYNMLANVLYTGRMRVDGEMYPAEHEAIIGERTFELVQEKLKQNARAGDKVRRKTDALLRGLIYCSNCGSAMYPTYSVSRNRQYRYYVCVRAKQGCETRPVAAPSVEEAVVESLRRFAVAPEVLQEAARAVWQRVDADGGRETRGSIAGGDRRGGAAG
jgi:site-specific DNA recombinase